MNTMLIAGRVDWIDGQELDQPGLPAVTPEPVCDWRAGLPVIVTPVCTLRELTIDDARSLFAHLTREEVARFISPPPTTVEGFEQFIRWAHRKRAEGKLAVFGIVPAGQTTAVGMFQARVIAEGEVAEWGFAMGSAFWGTGIFAAGAQRILSFIFTQLRVTRLEARSVVENGRGNGALKKIGAMRAMVLSGSFERHGQKFDQVLWIVTARAWAAMTAWPESVH